MKFFHFKEHSLRDSDGLTGGGGDFQPTEGDRGDEVIEPTNPAPNAEEARLAQETKDAADKKAAADKAAADKKVADDKKAAKKEGEDDDDDKDSEKRKDTRIPMARHKAMLEAERAEKDKLIARLAQYEGAEDLAKTNDAIKAKEDEIIKLEGEYTKLITDGKTDEATKVMRQIRILDREVSGMQTQLASAAAESRAYERARYDETVDRIEAAYPEMRPKNEDDEPNPEFEPTKVRKVLSIARAYQLDGFTPSKALQEAVKDILGAPKTKKQEQAVEVTPRVDEAAAKKAAREEEARKKATDAANKQPPNGKDLGKNADELGGSGTLSAADVLKMPYADFSKLDEKTLARLRGDTMEG